MLQSAESHDTWLVRWEYLRERPPGYPYALGHVHLQVDFATAPGHSLAAGPLARLHLPTARVAFESVLRHLISEWRVQPKKRRLV